MLVLSRRANEAIVVNHDIVVTVIEIRGDKVRIGIEAPRDVPVNRREVYEAIRQASLDTTTETAARPIPPAPPPGPPASPPPRPPEEPIFFG